MSFLECIELELNFTHKKYLDYSKYLYYKLTCNNNIKYNYILSICIINSFYITLLDLKIHCYFNIVETKKLF